MISFDVRIMFGQPAGITNIDVAGTSIDPFVTLWQAPFNLSNTAGGWNNGNPGFFPTNTTGPMVFDTWSSVKDGLPTDYSQWNVAGSATSIPLWNGLTGPVIKASDFDSNLGLQDESNSSSDYRASTVITMLARLPITRSPRTYYLQGESSHAIPTNQ